MKKTISPIAAILAIIAILGIAALAFWRSGAGEIKKDDPSQDMMPPQVTKEIQRRMGGMQPPPVK